MLVCLDTCGASMAWNISGSIGWGGRAAQEAARGKELEVSYGMFLVRPSLESVNL